MQQQVKHAVIRDQNVVFALVQVRDPVTESEPIAVNLINTLSQWYQCPVVLMGVGNGRLNGRGDLVKFLSGINPSQIPWREETVDYTKPQPQTQTSPRLNEQPEASIRR